MRWALRLLFGTRRGWRCLVWNALAAFGFASAIIQFYTAVWMPDHAFSSPIVFTGLVAFCSLLYGIWSAWPKTTVRREFGRPDMTVVVTVGDILQCEGQIVVGFTDTFDTQTSDGVIEPNSLQGQLLHCLYGGDQSMLDADLTTALAETPPVSTESASTKKSGKLVRYPVGTVAVLKRGVNTIYAVAYSRMGNNLVAKSSVHDLWYSLGQLWEAVYQHGQRAPVTMPLVGTELARINCLDRESLLKMAILSFVSRSREELICKELKVVVLPKDLEKINMLEVEAFLRSL